MEAVAKTDDEKVILYVFREIMKAGFGRLEVVVTRGKVDTIYDTEAHKPGDEYYQKVLALVKKGA